MGSLNEYQEYILFCMKLDITPLGDLEDYLKHKDDILEFYQVETEEELFKKLDESGQSLHS